MGCPFCTIGTELATHDENIRTRIAFIFEAHLRYFETALRDAVAEGLLPAAMDIKAKAQEIDALMIGGLTNARIRNSLTPVGETLRDAVFHSLGLATPQAMQVLSEEEGGE